MGSTAAASTTWLIESGKATGLWGVGMFVASLCSKQFGLNPAVAALAQRTGDFVTALILVGPQVNATMLKSQSILGVLCGLATGLLTTGASLFYNRALVESPANLLPPWQSNLQAAVYALRLTRTIFYRVVRAPEIDVFVLRVYGVCRMVVENQVL